MIVLCYYIVSFNCIHLRSLWPSIILDIQPHTVFILFVHQIIKTSETGPSVVIGSEDLVHTSSNGVMEWESSSHKRMCHENDQRSFLKTTRHKGHHPTLPHKPAQAGNDLDSPRRWKYIKTLQIQDGCQGQVYIQGKAGWLSLFKLIINQCIINNIIYKYT